VIGAQAKGGFLSKLDEARRLYADLMDEARWRLHALNRAIAERDQWAPKLLNEFCYLQFRMLCEQIAVACLVAHGDVTRKGIQKKYEPHIIMAELEKINPDFFPKGKRIRVDGEGVHLDDYDVPQLTKKELFKLWSLAGNELHQKNAKGRFANLGRPIVVNVDPLIAYTNKLVALLDQHVISSADKRTHLVVALSHEQANFECLVSVAKSPPGT
jgi:hypothetical protein